MFRKIINGNIMLFDEKKKKYVLECEHIMSKELNRELSNSEMVYHTNGNKKDNRIENLDIMDPDDLHSLYNNFKELIPTLMDKNILLYNKKNKKYIISSNTTERNMDVSLGFENIAIKQKKNICKSRFDANIKSEVIKGVQLDIPMIASNMSTVCDAEFCIELSKLGAMGVMHRATTDDKICTEVAKVARECEWVAASIGNGKNDIALASKIINAGANILFIDIAHGYSDISISIAKLIKLQFPDVKVVIGNTTNEDMLYEVSKFADALKVGIAQGFACETKNTAGCTEKQFSAIHKFKNISKMFNIPIISDGGIREPADLVKSIAAGANSIMAGKIFASCPTSAAEIIEIDGIYKKVYAGMSSRYVQDKWKGGLKKGTCPEGGVRYLDIGESSEDLINRYGGALRSGITYGGASNIIDFQERVEFVRLA